MSKPQYDNADINEPEKDSSNVKKTNEPFYLASQSPNDSLENLKGTSFPNSDESMQVDGDHSDSVDDSEEVTIMESSTVPKTGPIGRVSISKTIPKRVTNTPMKHDPPKSERKVIDPRVANEEMKRNYENEISVLKKQLQQVGLTGNPSEEALMKRCNMLESQLRKAQNEAESMTEQVTGLRSQLQTWPNRVRELEDENETLRGRVEDVRVINHQRQNEIDELHEIVKNLETKLWEQSSGSHHKEKIFLQRLMSEYDNLLKDYDLVKLNSMTNERKMYEARSRINELASKLSELEINYRKLESENNFLKRRITNEKSYPSSNYRGWDRNVYPPQISSFDGGFHFRNGSSQELMTSSPSPKPPMETGMMSMSCYGALPSYGDPIDNNDNVSPIRRFEFNKPRASERYSQNDMVQSVYTKPQRENVNVTTPTNDRRRVSILENVQYEKSAMKEGSLSFGLLNDNTVDLMTQQLNRQGSDHQIMPQASRRRQKPEAYNRDSWVESKTEEEKDIERRYDQLQNEKNQLLTNLSHIPTNSSARNRRSNRETRESLEAKLDHIDRQLGLMRMTMKQKNILK